ncbi:MAG: hypothetical protein QN163_06765 [Armatimonadota bacterium]|nr:hypothetical protein [Armatimonadota bacterium]MDR5698136.1 hypothetical protein [Armatimonadota bacterium]
MTRPLGAGLLVVAFLLGGTIPSGAADPLVRRAVSTFFRDAEVLRVDVVPDLYEGGYARVSVYAANATLAEGGLRIDEAWTRLVGVSFNPKALRAGEFRVDGVRDTAIHMRVSLPNLERYFVERNPWKDIRLWAQDGYLHGRGTVPLGGVPTRVELRGFFAAGNTPELYFYVDRLRVNGLPVPDPLLREMERRYNPLLTQDDWPVRFKLRSVRLVGTNLIVSSQSHFGDGCTFCGGGDPGTPTP